MDTATVSKLKEGAGGRNKDKESVDTWYDEGDNAARANSDLKDQFIV